MTAKNQKILTYLVLPLLFTAIWYGLASYTFNEKPDLNGDNFYYYMGATSLASGQGYSNLSLLGAPPTATYPIGYSLLMTPLRMITDSIVAQKWLNEIFVLASFLVLFFLLLRAKLPIWVSAATTIASMFVPRLWHFSTMMMSEASFCLTGILVLYAMVRLFEIRDWRAELRSPWLYVFVLALVLNYNIRTQGLALFAGVGLCLLVFRRWTDLGATAIAGVLAWLPWSLRNKALGLSNTRYFDMIMESNHWRPEDGTIGVSDLIVRFFETLKMLLFTAVPSSIPPFFNANPDAPQYTVLLYIAGIVLLVLMALGAYKLGRVGLAAIGYFVGTLGVISLFSTPSGNRYLTSILPMLTMLMALGLYQVLDLCFRKHESSAHTYAGYALSVVLVVVAFVTAKPLLTEEHNMAITKFPVQYQQFFKIGRELAKSTPKDAVICSRKPTMLWLYSDRPQHCYKFTSDDKELLLDLIEHKVDYVILDALGYSSTGLYLYPAIQKNPQYFQVVQHYDNTHTYLLRFHRDAAQSALNP